MIGCAVEGGRDDGHALVRSRVDILSYVFFNSVALPVRVRLLVILQACMFLFMPMVVRNGSS